MYGINYFMDFDYISQTGLVPHPQNTVLYPTKLGPRRQYGPFHTS